jgi:hypothetical protein
MTADVKALLHNAVCLGEMTSCKQKKNYKKEPIQHLYKDNMGQIKVH